MRSTRVKIKIGLQKFSIPYLLIYGRQVHEKMLSNVYFPDPYPALPDFWISLNELEAAIVNAHQGSVASTAVMYDKRDVVESMLSQLGLYVESRVNEPELEREQRIERVLTGGFSVKGFSPRQRGSFNVKHGRLSGSVILRAGGNKNGGHLWAYTLFPEEENSWIQLIPTRKATAEVTNLLPGNVYHFRHCTFGDELTPWEVIALMVV